MAVWYALYRLPMLWMRLLLLAVSPVLMLVAAEVYLFFAPDQIPPLFMYAYGGLMLGVGALLCLSRRRHGHDRCERCGYDMTGLDLAERCPECGTATELGREAADRDIQQRRREVNRQHAEAIRVARTRQIQQAQQPAEAPIGDHAPPAAHAGQPAAR